MQRVRSTMLLLALALPLVALAASTNEKSPTQVTWKESTYHAGLQLPANLKKKIYYIESYYADINHRFMAAGAEIALKELGWDYEILNPENDLATQIKMIEDSLAKGDMDGMIINAVDPGGVAASLKKVMDRGIPVAIMDRWPTLGRPVFGVGSNWYQEGELTTKQMIKLLTDKYGEPKGKVIAIVSGLENNAIRQRYVAFKDIMPKYPKIQVIEKTAPEDPVKCAQVLKDALLANPDVDAIWNIVDYFGMNFVQTMKEIHMAYPVGDPKHIILCSQDGTDWALQAIRDGYFDSTVSHYLIDFGYMCTWALGQHFGGKSDAFKVGPFKLPSAGWNGSSVRDYKNGTYLELNTILVTKANVDDPSLVGNRVKEFLK